jgi:glucosamine-6-phosphate deaminase
MGRLNFFEETRFEKLPVSVYATEKEASLTVAQHTAEIIKSKQAKGEMAVLGLATSATPIRVYENLVNMHKNE